MKIEIDIPDYIITQIQDVAKSVKLGVGRKLTQEELVEFICDDMVGMYSENLHEGLVSAIQHRFE